MDWYASSKKDGTHYKESFLLKRHLNTSRHCLKFSLQTSPPVEITLTPSFPSVPLPCWLLCTTTILNNWNTLQGKGIADYYCPRTASLRPSDVSHLFFIPNLTILACFFLLFISYSYFLFFLIRHENHSYFPFSQNLLLISHQYWF